MTACSISDKDKQKTEIDLRNHENINASQEGAFEMKRSVEKKNCKPDPQEHIN